MVAVELARAKKMTIRPDLDGRFPELLPGPLKTFLGEVALGNGSALKVGVMRTMNGLFVGVVGHGAQAFEEGRALGPHDAAYYLGVTNLRDAENVADLLNDQLCRAAAVRRAGTYESRFCEPHGEELQDAS